MEVRLLAYTPEPERLVAASCKTSTNQGDTAELYDEVDSPEKLEKARKLIKAVIGMGHESVAEHASFTFSISGVSRSLTHELVRHRIASFTQQSQRYVKFEDLTAYVTPHTVENGSDEVKKTYSEALEYASAAYKKLLDAGLPPEDARFVLPNAAKTNIVVTMNARELNHFFALRCCERAQWEIREMATEMLRLVRGTAPSLFDKAGPNCYRLGYCTEGKQTCGRMQEVVEKFKNL